MRFAPTDDQIVLRDAVRGLLADLCPPEVIRRAWNVDTPLDETVWAQLAAMGVLGVLVPESAGGLGMTFDEMVLVLEEAGYAGLPHPLLEHAAVTLPLAVEAGLIDVAAAGVAGQQLVLAVGIDGGDTVAHGRAADVVLVITDDGVAVQRRSMSAWEAVTTVDRSRRLSRWVGDADQSLPVDRRHIESARQRGVVGAAALLVGAARRCLDMTVDYVSSRQQFGVPVGSFQGLKHQMATAVMELEFARPAVLRAAHSLAIDNADAARHAAMAKAMASDAAHLVARTCLQAHGAIGYTVEHDLHLWFKRIEAMNRSWGSAADHRGHLAGHFIKE